MLFTVTSTRTTEMDIQNDWEEIRTCADDVLAEEAQREAAAAMASPRARVRLAETRARNAAFGSSLLLANSPLSPKIVNGSFAAIFEAGDGVVAGCARLLSEQLRLETAANASDSPGVRRRLRGLLLAGRQFSLDACLDLVHGAGGVSPGGRPRSTPDSGLSALPPPEEESTIEDNPEDESVSTSPDVSGQQASDEADAYHIAGPSTERGTDNRTVKFANSEHNSVHHLEDERETRDGCDSVTTTLKICHKCGHALVK